MEKIKIKVDGDRSLPDKALECLATIFYEMMKEERTKEGA